MTDVILAKLGHSIVVPETFEALRAEHPALSSDLLPGDVRWLWILEDRDFVRADEADREDSRDDAGLLHEAPCEDAVFSFTSSSRKRSRIDAEYGMLDFPCRT